MPFSNTCLGQKSQITEVNNEICKEAYKEKHETFSPYSFPEVNTLIEVYFIENLVYNE